MTPAEIPSRFKSSHIAADEVNEVRFQRPLILSMFWHLDAVCKKEKNNNVQEMMKEARQPTIQLQKLSFVITLNAGERVKARH